jgi:Uma2 family endonuclease
MATVHTTAGQSLLLDNIDWSTYTRLLRIFGKRPAVHLTYDRGMLEIRTLSPEHERLKHLLRRLIEALAEELGMSIAGFGSMTCRRRGRRRGLEPDECYWIAHEPQVRGKDRIDLRTDPPPDLAVEVDITHSSLDRLGIYAKLGVPEVWRLDDQGLTFHVLQAKGKYAAQGQSPAFPFVRPADVLSFLAQRGQLDETAILRQFRAWVRQQAGGNPPAQPTP